jgi:hypothetical protein
VASSDGDNGSFSHLHPDIRALVDAPRDDRVAEIWRKRFIEHAKSEPIWNRVRNMMLMRNGNASNAALLLLSHAGIGKTELLRFLAEKIEEEIREDVGLGRVPRLKKPLQFVVDRCSTERLLVGRLSGGLYKGRRSPTEDVDELLSLVESWNRLEAGGLFLDELSDIGKGTAANQLMICQDLRLILNRYRRPLVGATNLESEEVFTMDRNLATRFQMMKIDPWQPDGHLRDFLLQLFEYKPLKYGPEFEWDPFLRWLVDRTQGVTREIITQTNLAAIEAIDSGIERMNWSMYRQAGGRG